MTIKTACDGVRAAGRHPETGPLAEVTGWMPVDDDDLAPGAEPEDRRHPAQKLLELFHFASRFSQGCLEPVSA